MADEAAETTSEEEVVLPDPETDSPAEDDTSQADETESDGEADIASDESDEADAGEEQSETDEPKADASDDPKEAARRGYAERTRVRTEVSQALDEIAKPQTAEDLIAQGTDPALAEVEALRQEIQRKDVINHVTELNTGLNSDAVQVMRDFPIFNEGSPEYDEEIAKTVEDLYKRAANMQMDPSGRFVTQANMPLYEFYSFANNLLNRGTQQGQVKGQRAAEKMIASAESPSSSQGKDTEMDPFEKGLKGL